MKIIKPGTSIKTKMGNIDCLVTGVCIRMDSMMYEIAYFVGGKRESIWVYPYEIELNNVTKGQIGLLNTNTEIVIHEEIHN